MVAATKPANIDHLFAKKSESIGKEKSSVETKAKENRESESKVPPQLPEVVKDEKSEFKTPLPNPENVQNDKGDQEVFKVPKLPKRPADSEPSTSESDEKQVDESETTSTHPETNSSESKHSNVPAGYGLIHRKDLQALKNNELLAKKRRIQQDEESEFFEDQKDTRDEKMEIQPEPEDNAVWVPPTGQTGDGWTKLNEKFGGRY